MSEDNKEEILQKEEDMENHDQQENLEDIGVEGENPEEVIEQPEKEGSVAEESEKEGNVVEQSENEGNLAEQSEKEENVPDTSNPNIENQDDNENIEEIQDEQADKNQEKPTEQIQPEPLEQKPQEPTEQKQPENQNTVDAQNQTQEEPPLTQEASINEVQFSIDECYSNLGTFLLRGKLIRDIVLKQCLFILGRVCIIKKATIDNKLPEQKKEPKGFFSMLKMNNLSSIQTKTEHTNQTEQNQIEEHFKTEHNDPIEVKNESINLNLTNESAANETNANNLNTQKPSNLLKIGIIGAGVMGKQLYYTFKGKSLHGMTLDVSMSTRVPERFFKETLTGEKIFRDNEKITRDNDIIFLCIPKHKCNAVLSQIKTIFHRRINEDVKKRVLIFSIVGNLTQTKLDTQLSCEKDSLSLTTCLNYEKIEDAVEKISREYNTSPLEYNQSEVSDKLSFDCFKNERYVSKIYEILNQYASKKGMLASNPIFKGIVQFLNNKARPLDNHFYKVSLKNAALNYNPDNEENQKEPSEAKPEEKIIYSDDFSKFIMGMSSDEFTLDTNTEKARELFTETILSIRKGLEKLLDFKKN